MLYFINQLIFVCLFVLGFWLCLKATPGYVLSVSSQQWLEDYVVPEIQVGLTASKASTLKSILFLQFSAFILFSFVLYYIWQCSDITLSSVQSDHMGFWGSNMSWLCARHMSYLLYYLYILPKHVYWSTNWGAKDKVINKISEHSLC